jgi:hypothetical protein
MRTDRLCGIEMTPKPAVGARCWQQARMALALALGFSLAERLPSADRSQQILNTAGRHRDSAARLC